MVSGNPLLSNASERSGQGGKTEKRRWDLVNNNAIYCLLVSTTVIDK